MSQSLKVATFSLVNYTVGPAGRDVPVTWPVPYGRIKAVTCSYSAYQQAAVLVVGNWTAEKVNLRATVQQEYDVSFCVFYA